MPCLVQRSHLVKVDVLVQRELQGRGDVVRVVVLGMVVPVAVGVDVFVVAVVRHLSVYVRPFHFFPCVPSFVDVAI